MPTAFTARAGEGRPAEAPACTAVDVLSDAGLRAEAWRGLRGTAGTPR
ncbi:hypothetical protein [Streptomyces aurantiogriseus]|uniref:Uncharacterized protein n=1 Tax=Streptomyces aurantiogriseus TaxID=66870 RepID=A0A918FC14_9ACTN|nr:hypothetical protein [Streptomyces aurantiogriseus]GGR29211.1 hypothetical protein GCM10010251_51800 [Streptomyces aurantiogriseus]